MVQSVEETEGEVIVIIIIMIIIIIYRVFHEE